MVGRIVVQAETEEAALEEAVKALGADREAIEYETRRESDQDLLPGAKPQVEVEAWIKAEWVADRAEERLRGLLERFDMEFEIHREIRDRIVHLDIEAGEDASLLIGRDGQNLGAIQYLINRMTLKSGREAPMILIDVGGYKQKQYRELEKLAQRAVTRARETGNEIELDPMSPSTRKYLHNFLTRFDGIKTFSRGEEPDRYLVIVAD